MTQSLSHKIIQTEEISMQFGNIAENQEEKWLADGFEKWESKITTYTNELLPWTKETIS